MWPSKAAEFVGASAGGLLFKAFSGFSAILAAFTAIFLTLFLLIDLPRIVGAIDAVPIVASIQIIARELTARRRAEMAELRVHGLPQK